MIGLHQVSVRYGAAAALDEVSATVAAGEWLAVIGPNGAGKTTLLRAVARLTHHEGRVAIDGQPTAGLSRRALARLVAYVPQAPVLPSEMTVGDYVLLGRSPHIGYLRMETRADRRIRDSLLERLDLAPMAGRTLATLSGGEAQRAVLARALAQQAPVLLLDEPTSALDLGRRVDALELIDELRRERSLTVVSAVHDLTLAGEFADRLLLLAAGRVAACGTPASVLRGEVLSRHFGPDVQVLTAPDGAPVVLSRRRGSAPHARPGRPGSPPVDTPVGTPGTLPEGTPGTLPVGTAGAPEEGTPRSPPAGTTQVTPPGRDR